jgi:hypothetical protein
MAETAELDTTQEAPSPNGHDDTWQTFDDDGAFLQHILSKKPAEQIVDVPEWNVRVLCRALNAEHRIEVETRAFNKETKLTNYVSVSHLVLMYGCYNPTTGNPVFYSPDDNEAQVKQKEATMKTVLMRQQDGGAIERLALTILHLSRMIAEDAERAKKN